MSQSAGQRIGRKDKQQSIGWKSERFRRDEDKPWNFRSNKQKAGSSAGPLMAISERLEHFC